MAVAMIDLIVESHIKRNWPDVYAALKRARKQGGLLYVDAIFMGLATVYKLSVRSHIDRRDYKICVTMPVGNFTGGCMLFPDVGISVV